MSARAIICWPRAGSKIRASCSPPTRSLQQGVGNAYDLVGRYFMEHPHARGGRIVGKADWRWLSAFAKRRVNGIEVSPAITPAESLQRREGLLNSAR